MGHAQKVALASPFLSLAGCLESDAGEIVSFGGRTMGTSYSVKMVAPPPGIDADTLAREVDGLLATVNQQMSTYLADSELSRFNNAPAGRWIPVSEDTLSVVTQSQRLHALTDGAFDPTVGPVVDLWGFGPDGGHHEVPPDDRIRTAHAVVGLDKVESKSGTATALLKNTQGVRLDFSGAAKGYGVDKVAAHLTQAGVMNYLVEVGGELRSHGHGPAGGDWRIGVEKPSQAADEIQHVIHLRDGEALATSGNYRIYFEHDGQRYSHIVNPRTGRPVTHNLASVSVVAPTTLEADALSTSLLVLGPEAGMAFATANNIQAFFISGQEGHFYPTASPAFSQRMTG